MSREYLCRAKRVNWKELPKEEWWVEGQLLRYRSKSFIIPPSIGIYHTDKQFRKMCDTLFSLQAHEVVPKTVCQYTGTDLPTGEAKIFENDILFIPNHSPNIIVVRFTEESFLLFEDNGRYLDIFHYIHHLDVSDIKVIGNIFDNSELLKGDWVI